MALDHKDVLERHDAFAQHDRHNREDALDDLRFGAGFQWDEDVANKRRDAGLPVITVNRLMQFSNQVVGDLRQSQPSIELTPSDTETSEDLVQIYSGLIRQIEYQSGATSVYSWGGKCAIDCGIGHWQIVTEYADDTTFDQDIRVKRILDPLSVTWDSSATELDRSDATECFVSEMWTSERFKATFGKEVMPTDFPKPTAQTSLPWLTDDGKQVRLASWWRKVPVKSIIGLLDDGRVVELDKEEAKSFPGKMREVTTHKIVHRLVSGSDFMSDDEDWAGKHIPIIPVIGNEISVDGRILRSGIIRHAKDAQRVYNYFRSSAASVIGMQPKAPWLVPQFAIEGHVATWQRANSEALPYLPYNVDPNFPNLKPERSSPPQSSGAMYQELQVSESDMYGTTGIYPSSLGGKSNETSGKAITARQREADTGTFVYFDNFQHSMRRTGEILIDLIPRVYDSPRIVRVLGDDGTEAMAQVNITDPATGAIINDISSAKFDVRVKVGPSFASSREQAREAMTALIQANPQFMNVMGDLYFETMDFKDASKLAARFKKTMPAELVGEGGAEQPPNPANELQMEAAQLNNQRLAADVQGKQLANMQKAHQFGLEAVDASTPVEPA